MKRVTFPSEAHYLEAWRYLVRIGSGFTYHRTEHWVEVESIGDAQDDEDTMERLQEIVNTRTEDLLGYI